MRVSVVEQLFGVGFFLDHDHKGLGSQVDDFIQVFEHERLHLSFSNQLFHSFIEPERLEDCQELEYVDHEDVNVNTLRRRFIASNDVVDI